MNLKLNLTLFLAAVSIGLISLLSPTPVIAKGPAPTEQTAIWTLPAQVNSDILQLEGYRPGVRFNLFLPPGWNPSADGQLTLDYRLSELAQLEARLTVRLNNQYLHSVAFERNAGQLNLNLPADFFQPGKNTLELAAILPLIEDDECIVPDHPARWLAFGPASQISLPLASDQSAFNLADFPMQFEALGDEDNARITFVLPDEPDNQELSALSAVAFVLAREAETHPEWSVVSANNFDPDELTGPVVLMGTAGRNHYLDSLAPISSDQSGWLSLTAPDWSKGQPALAVSGPDGGAVLQTAEALADPLAILQMNGDTAVIDTLQPHKVESLPEEFTLTELGYSERTVRGTGEQSLIYTFDIPFAWSPTDGRLKLHFVHSAILNPQLASLTVFLNGRIVAGIQLDAPESASNMVETSIPKALMRPGRNFLRLSFDFGSPPSSCNVGSTEDGMWASVRPDTTLTLSHENIGGRLNLGDFPYLFASEVDLSELAIVLPAQATETDIIDALEVVRNLSLSGLHIAPRLILAESITEKTTETHLILLGDFSRQPALAELNALLPLPFDLATGVLLPTYGIHLPTNAPDLGVVQTLRSPWAENRIIFVVSGTSSPGYNQAMQLLTDPSLQSQLDGQVALASARDDTMPPQVHTQYIADLNVVSGVGFMNRIFGQFFEAGSPWPAIVTVFVGLLVMAAAAIFGLRLIRRRQASQPAKH
jgi:hypothetical protein